MQNQNLNLFRPRRVAAKIHYSMISQFMFIWVKWNRPCDLKSRTRNYWVSASMSRTMIPLT